MDLKMNNNEYLSASEKLSAFIDGELDSAESGNLFYEMASDTELQEEMKELLLIKNSFKNKIIAPPPVLKNNIVAGLGLAGAANNATKIAAGVLLLNFLRHNSISLVLGLALLIVAYLAFAPSEENNLVLETNIPISNSSEAIPEAATEQSSLAKAQGNENISSIIIDNSNKSDDIIPSKKSSENIITNDNEKSNLSPLDKQSPDILKINSAYFSDNNTLIADNKPKYDLMNWLYSKKIANILGDFSIQFRVADGKSYPSPDVKTNQGRINDFAVSLLYKLNQNSSIGIEFGRENFLMEFEGYEGDFLYRYPQSFNAMNWGAFYQYEFEQLSISQNLIPYSRLFIGGTNVGPLARISIGTNYMLSHNLALNASADYGILVYSHLDNYFNTQKFSWSIGLSLGL